jgi:precorrin-3B synthase
VSTRPDACPGVFALHDAADGALARVRLPGGAVDAAALQVLAGCAEELGDGALHLTSRGNVQLRGLRRDDPRLSRRLAAAGLLPSMTHERVRNVLASPLSGITGGLADVRDLAPALDRQLCARPALAGLSGRFLFAVDDGREDVAWLDADVAALFVEDAVAILLGNTDVGLRVAPSEVASTMLACAEAFLSVRGDEWRVAELPSGPARIAEVLGGVVAGPRIERGVPATRGPVGIIDQPDGLMAVAAAVPLGRLTHAQGMVLAEAADLVITPWRGVVVPDLLPEHADRVVDRLAASGLLLDPRAPGIGVTACAGRPGCANALADVRADAAAMIAASAVAPFPVHWSGCSRRCGRPRGEAIDIVATGHGYTVTRELR